MARRVPSNIEQLVDDRRFDLASVQTYLDDLDFPDLSALLQAPEVVTVYARPGPLWHEGDPRPVLADDRPEVMSAIARCSLNRQRQVYTGSPSSAFHVERCGWCDYPHRSLLEALDWWIVQERRVLGQWWVWMKGTSPRDRRIQYRRATGQIDHYENPAAERFHWSMPDDLQREAVDQVQRDTRPPEIATVHEPWCQYEPDHPGDCSPHPASDVGRTLANLGGTR